MRKRQAWPIVFKPGCVNPGQTSSRNRVNMLSCNRQKSTAKEERSSFPTMVNSTDRQTNSDLRRWRGFRYFWLRNGNGDRHHRAAGPESVVDRALPPAVTTAVKVSAKNRWRLDYLTEIRQERCRWRRAGTLIILYKGYCYFLPRHCPL